MTTTLARPSTTSLRSSTDFEPHSRWGADQRRPCARPPPQADDAGVPTTKHRAPGGGSGTYRTTSQREAFACTPRRIRRACATASRVVRRGTPHESIRPCVETRGRTTPSRRFTRSSPLVEVPGSNASRRFTRRIGHARSCSPSVRRLEHPAALPRLVPVRASAGVLRPALRGQRAQRLGRVARLHAARGRLAGDRAIGRDRAAHHGPRHASGEGGSNASAPRRRRCASRHSSGRSAWR